MRNLVLALSLIILTDFCNGQQYNKSPILITDFVKGLNDFNYLKGILIENGFQYFGDFGNSERWLFFEKRCENIYESIAKGVLLKVDFDNYNTDSLKPFSTIIFEISKTMSDYNTQFLNDVKKNFPERKVEHDSGVYILYYLSKSSTREIIYQESELYFHYQIY
jgi:hypothetical protein